MITTRSPRSTAAPSKNTQSPHARRLDRGCPILDGDFIVSDAKKQYVFIAGGIGITPFRAILKEAEHEGKSLCVTLIYANRKKTVAAYNKESVRWPNESLFQNPLPSFHPQRIDKKTIREFVPDLKTFPLLRLRSRADG